MRPMLFTGVLFVLLISCGFAESMKKMEAVRNDLQKTFHHEAISTSFRSGTGGDELSVVFNGFEIKQDSPIVLVRYAASVHDRILSRFPETRRFDRIEVGFVGQDESGVSRRFTFNYPKEVQR